MNKALFLFGLSAFATAGPSIKNKLVQTQGGEDSPVGGLPDIDLDCECELPGIIG